MEQTTAVDPMVTELNAALAAAGRGLAVTGIDRLTGGASRGTYAVSALDVEGEPVALILQKEMGEPRRPEGLAAEAALVRRAGEAGVPIAGVVLTHADVGETPELGSSWFVSEAIEGETIARRLLRDDDFASARKVLTAQLGEGLARTHQVPLEGLDFLEVQDELSHYRQVADDMGMASPAFELGFRWLEQHRPVAARTSLVHGDFRLGNLIVGPTGLEAVIDWELAHIGDPMEDLGWLCVRAWRFGGPGPVAGIGERADLFASYEAASGEVVDPEVVRWWELLGNLKWGVMCGLQAARHRSGTTRSVELAAIGRRVTEQEYDVVRLLQPDLEPPAGASQLAGGNVQPDMATIGQQIPATELLEAVAEFIAGPASEQLSGAPAFHARVAKNVLAIVERELRLAPEYEVAHHKRLTELGMSSDAELAAAIRDGGLDNQWDMACRVVFDRAVDQLVINNPRWI